jgi:hypothetical protein
MTTIYCSKCQNNEAFTIFDGAALCRHCYEEKNEAWKNIDKEVLEKTNQK